jgi:hypothetical protein
MAKVITKHVSLFCNLFNEAFSVTQTTERRMKGRIKRTMNWNGCRRKRSWPIFRSSKRFNSALTSRPQCWLTPWNSPFSEANSHSAGQEISDVSESAVRCRVHKSSPVKPHHILISTTLVPTLFVSHQDLAKSLSALRISPCVPHAPPISLNQAKLCALVL